MRRDRRTARRLASATLEAEGLQISDAVAVEIDDAAGTASALLPPSIRPRRLSVKLRRARRAPHARIEGEQLDAAALLRSKIGKAGQAGLDARTEALAQLLGVQSRAEMTRRLVALALDAVGWS